MNIIQAVKSGKLMKRENCLVWIRAKDNAFYWIGSVTGKERLYDIIPEDVLAENWEIKDEPGDS